MKRILGWFIAATAVSSAASAQQQTVRVPTAADTASWTVRTLPLRHLSNSDAATLLAPYVGPRGGHVFPLGPSIHAVTVQGSGATIAEMEKLLAQYDRSPLTVSLNFQLIAADNTTTRDPSLAGLDSELRSVLKFSGYRLLTTAVVNISEGSMATQSLSADGQDYRLSYDMTEVSGTGSDATVHVRVELRRVGLSTSSGAPKVDPMLLSTGVTIPIGHTVVLGSTAEGETRGPAPKALILTVRPQVAPLAKD